MSMTEGFNMVPLMMGLYAISEMFKQAQEVMAGETFNLKVKTDTTFPKWSEIKRLFPFNIFGSIIGVIVGVMPGAGATVASFLGYSWAKRLSKDPDSFGKGNPAGVAVPESANNGATGGAMVPLLALGIPGSNSTAIMLSALMIHNVTPGPMLFTKSPEIPYSLFVSMLFANIFMFFVGYLFIKFAIKVTSISKQALVAVIIALVFTGVYAYSLEIFSVAVALAFGLIGMILRRFEIPHTASVLGFVLGFIMEANLRRALIVSEGSMGGAFFNSTLSSILLIAAFASIALSIARGVISSRKSKTSAAA
jgi:putative tricarboxylic transport membrane protein